MSDLRDGRLTDEGTNRARNVLYRRILPVFQFIVCIAVLFPLRGAIVAGIHQSIRAQRAGRPHVLPHLPASTLQSPADPAGHHAPYSQPVFLVISRPMSREEIRRKEVHDALLTIPTALNFPVFMIERPLAIFSSPETGGSASMDDLRLWRALTFPVVGLFFWWIAGRAIDALYFLRRGMVLPRLQFIEGFAGALIMVVGLSSSLVMLADESVLADASLGLFALGAGLWAVLGFLSTITCLIQWYRRQSASHAVENSVPN